MIAFSMPLMAALAIAQWVRLWLQALELWLVGSLCHGRGSFLLGLDFGRIGFCSVWILARIGFCSDWILLGLDFARTGFLHGLDFARFGIGFGPINRIDGAMFHMN